MGTLLHFLTYFRPGYTGWENTDFSRHTYWGGNLPLAVPYTVIVHVNSLNKWTTPKPKENTASRRSYIEVKEADFQNYEFLH